MTTPYFVELQKRTKDMGGFFNAHLHLDRAGTYEATLHLLEGTRTSASSLSLSKKHALIPLIHSSNCYEPDQLEARVADCLQELIGAGTTRADTVVDVTADRVGLGNYSGQKSKENTCTMEIIGLFVFSVLFPTNARATY